MTSAQNRKPGPVVLCIMDGWGLAPDSPHNAVSNAHTPVFDKYWQHAPSSQLNASEKWVGLPDNQPGNSEVGHMTIGAGRVILQDLVRISHAVETGELANHSELMTFTNTLKQSGKAAHITGLCSPGGVHAHSLHIAELANSISALGVPVYLHLITDGRDRLPKQAGDDIPELLAQLDSNVTIASLTGRYFAMDRDRRWARTQAFIEVMSLANADYHAKTALDALTAGYGRDETDEFIAPTLIADYGGLQPGDGLIIANFRVDRVRQLLDGLLTPENTDIALQGRKHPQLGPVLTMTPVSEQISQSANALFLPPDLSGGLGASLHKAGLTQLRLAETEKYPHVTYFFNGGDETAVEGEDRIMIASPQVATYDLQPEMSAEQVTEAALNALHTRSHDVIIINFANPDMVGHTGSLEAAIHAVETTDKAVGKLADAIHAYSGTLLITADHGNCEVMWDEAADSPHTAHTINKVPLMILGSTRAQIKQLHDGSLADLAPTLLDLIGVGTSEQMTGHSLIEWE